MSTASEGMTSDQCRRCGRHVGLVGRGIDFLFGCRRRGCHEVVDLPAPPATKSEPAPMSPKIRFEGHPF